MGEISAGPQKCEDHAVAIAELRKDNEAMKADLARADRHFSSIEVRFKSMEDKFQQFMDTINAFGNKGWMKVASVVVGTAQTILAAYIILKLKGG